MQKHKELALTHVRTRRTSRQARILLAAHAHHRSIGFIALILNGLLRCGGNRLIVRIFR